MEKESGKSGWKGLHSNKSNTVGQEKPLLEEETIKESHKGDGHGTSGK